jgi:hypothetical protein
MNFIPVQLDKSRNILLGFQALKLFKKISGKSLMKVDFDNEDFEDFIPLIFFVGLVHEDKELTLEKTTELIDKHLGIKGAMELLPNILAELQPDDGGIKNGVAAAKKKKK